jgi:hypothetical protein
MHSRNRSEERSVLTAPHPAGNLLEVRGVHDAAAVEIGDGQDGLGFEAGAVIVGRRACRGRGRRECGGEREGSQDS